MISCPGLPGGGVTTPCLRDYQALGQILSSASFRTSFLLVNTGEAGGIPGRAQTGHRDHDVGVSPGHFALDGGLLESAHSSLMCFLLKNLLFLPSFFTEA